MKVKVLLSLSALLLLGLSIWGYHQASIRHTLSASIHGVCRVLDDSTDHVRIISPTTGESQVYRVSNAYINLCVRSMSDSIPITIYREVSVAPYYHFFVVLTATFLMLLGGVFILLIRRM